MQIRQPLTKILFQTIPWEKINLEFPIKCLSILYDIRDNKIYLIKVRITKYIEMFSNLSNSHMKYKAF